MFAVTLANGLFGLVERFTGRKQKREVSFSEEYATKAEIQRIERNVEKMERKVETAVAEIRTEMKEDREKILIAGETRAGKIHSRIDDILEAVARMEGRTQRT